MASYGIIGVNPDSLKVIRDMQQFKSVHVHDKYKTSLKPFKNVNPKTPKPHESFLLDKANLILKD